MLGFSSTELEEAAAELGISVEEAERRLDLLSFDDLDDEQELVLDELAEQERRDPHLAYITNSPGVGVLAAAPWVHAVVNDPRPKVAVFGSNRSGKTFMLAWELIAIGLDRHPVIRATEDRQLVVVVLPDKGGSWASDICKAVRKLIPAEALDPRCKYWEDRGYRVGNTPMILFRNGVQVEPKASTQRGRSQAGGEGILAIFYNEPMTPSTLEETMRQATDVSGTGAPTCKRIYTTPFDADQPLDHIILKVCGHLLEFEEPTEALEPIVQPTGWVHYRIDLVAANVPHRSQQSIDDQYAETPAASHAQRLHGRLRGPTRDRKLSCWSGEQGFGLPIREWRLLPGLRRAHGNSTVLEEIRFGVAADHGQGPGKQVFILYAWAGEGATARVWILDCYRNPGVTPLQEDVARVVEMLARWRLRPTDISDWHGDINAKMNDTITRAIQLIDPTWRGRMKVAAKGKESLGHGENVLDDALGRVVEGQVVHLADGSELIIPDVPALQVFQGAQDVVAAFETYQGKSIQEPAKNVIDAVRYGVVDKLDYSRSFVFDDEEPLGDGTMAMREEFGVTVDDDGGDWFDY